MNTTAATIRSDPDRVRLEEFTCDVSLEDGKKPQPLQFSFTLYDLDGHGKITKDDIAGIVSTIYESIGKSVVVPHYGSKTINVRLTVSPDGKTATKSAATVKKAIITPRRRYRPRKLISDDDGSDTSENVPPAKVKESNLSKAAALAAAAAPNNTTITSDTATPSNAANRSTGLSKSSEATLTMPESPTYHNNLIAKSALNTGKQQQGHENVYESISNLKCCNLQQQQPQHQMHNATATTGLNHSTASTAALICRECSVAEEGQRSGVTMPTVQTVVLTPSVAMTAAIVGAGRTKRKLVRKTRSSRKVVPSSAAKPGEDFGGRPRARSLSVGNENCYENVIGQVAQEECWKSSLCRRELIEIIRESMVKNSLCFQPNRKAMESSPKHRHRSHTIASRVGDQVFFNYHHPTAAAIMAARGVEFGATGGGGTATTTALVTLAGGHETTNLCGYDSYLHQTICAAAANGTGTGAVHLATTHTAATAAISNVASPLAASIPNRLLLQHSHHSKAKRKEHRMMLAAASPRTGTTHHATPVKLSTALLNQQYPNLSAEQKLTRSINQVEQWLDHRGPKLATKGKLAEAEVRPLKRSKSKEELTIAGGKQQHTQAVVSGAANFLTTDVLLENLKISEDMAEIAVVTPKKVYNKESLIASATKKNIKTHHRTIVEEKASEGVCPKVVQLQYGSIPINADPSECENLIRMSDEGEEEPPVLLQSSSVPPQRHHPHKQSQSQPQSPQHHQQQSQQQQRFCGVGRAHSVSSASAASTTAVHRYVHEHIHHHYHHFENDPDES
uniref:Protein naked cuticle homolog n=1 Tax=Anopheles darlingi TaxID=43151 RepID=A0A675B3U6_ANODA